VTLTTSGCCSARSGSPASGRFEEIVGRFFPGEPLSERSVQLLEDLLDPLMPQQVCATLGRVENPLHDTGRTVCVVRFQAIRESFVSYTVDFENVSTTGVESSPVAEALAGLRANEARYFMNKYEHAFTVESAKNARSTVDFVSRVLKEERDIVISSPALEATSFEVNGIRMAYVFYESGLSINVMYTTAAGGKRAVGFKLSDGMEVPAELVERFKFARQKSKLAGTIRGSFFVIKGEY
jgi:hypothetical protein